jgi:alginate O-acetyltransferase complex protein AlgJ
MAHVEQPLPGGGLDRELVAHIEIGQTKVSPGTVRLLLAVFLTTIAAVPIVEWAAGRSAAGETAWSHLSRLPGAVSARLAEAAGQAEPTAWPAGVWRRIVEANRAVLEGLTAFESALEDESRLAHSIRPSAQLVMTGWLGGGSEQAYRGSEGWIFYRPDVEYVTGPGFLEAWLLERRIAAAPEWENPPQPDPRRAIVQFRNDLHARGISLVVVPTPLKPAIHPEKLASGFFDAGVLQNPSYLAFIESLRQEDVLVFDPADALAGIRRAEPAYLATDTHWRPESMELVADQLAGIIGQLEGLPTAADPGYRVERAEVSNVGDAARMLDLPEGTTLFPPETVYLRRILQPDGTPWRSSRESDVLLLGDSFTNIYALESMGWGTSAGLAEQLSYSLRRPIDRLTQNDDGAFATREMLIREPARLDGKRVVVYQFAARELAFGDWRILR